MVASISQSLRCSNSLPLKLFQEKKSISQYFRCNVHLCRKSVVVTFFVCVPVSWSTPKKIFCSILASVLISVCIGDNRLISRFFCLFVCLFFLSCLLTRTEELQVLLTEFWSVDFEDSFAFPYSHFHSWYLHLLETITGSKAHRTCTYELSPKVWQLIHK